MEKQKEEKLEGSSERCIKIYHKWSPYSHSRCVPRQWTGSSLEEQHHSTTSKASTRAPTHRPKSEHCCVEFHCKESVLVTKSLLYVFYKDLSRNFTYWPRFSVFSGPAATRQPRQKNFKKREKLRRRFAHLDEWWLRKTPTCNHLGLYFNRNNSEGLLFTNGLSLSHTSSLMHKWDDTCSLARTSTKECLYWYKNKTERFV